ncbi:hypothetical protein SLEP1_g59237 [Rubroshorea leprosula]|uniref:Uncharacterized protein n=1 Tax=Rubroshorea leprosula TaxID=152421 RepID=A0AAV5MVB4_9ROSI|nr:hypothetical protein SLEP1_g59237 [Rubroshorea leprosula]
MIPNFTSIVSYPCCPDSKLDVCFKPKLFLIKPLSRSLVQP